MDIQNSIMEIDISIMNIFISIMNSHTPVMDIYILIMNTHYFIMDKYGWICSYVYIGWMISITEIMDSHYWSLMICILILDDLYTEDIF